MKSTIENPKVFISYAWGDKENQQRVINFATSLVECGIDVILDRWNLKEGNDKYAFMEKCVTDKTVTNVLLLLDKNYTDKANERKGGVGDETQIISAEIYGKVEQSKFLPIVFTRGENGEIFKPAYLQSTLHVDLSDYETYDVNFQYLVKLLYGVEIYKKPELGRKPNFVEEEITIPTKTIIKFESIKRQANIQARQNDFVGALKEISEKILAYKIDDIHGSEDFYDAYLNKYNETVVIRDEFLELLNISFCVDSNEKLIASFFEDAKNRSYSSRTMYPEIIQILIQELFTYTVAFYLKSGQYDRVDYLLGRTYFDRNREATSFLMFQAYDTSNLDDAKNSVDRKGYITGTGKVWLDNLNYDFCTREEFILADTLCYNYSIISSIIHKDKNYWFPTIYIYGIDVDRILLKDWSINLLSKERCQEVIKLFGFEDLNIFKLRFAEVEKERDKGYFLNYKYANSYYAAPVICHFVKSSDIGKYR